MRSAMTRRIPKRVTGRGRDLARLRSEDIGHRAGAAAVFGDSVTQGELTVIPVARSMFRFSAGSGLGRTDTPPSGRGGGVFRPIGYIEITPRRARFRSTHDQRGLIMLAVLGLAILLRTVARRSQASAAERGAEIGEASREHVADAERSSGGSPDERAHVPGAERAAIRAGGR